MKLYSENTSYKLYQGNMLDMLKAIQPNSIDSIVTDPPYELNFMGKGWDNAGVSFQSETWRKCFEVLKSGGYLLAFGGSRTYHRIACAIEDAGFEIRDTIMWLYGSGFPKGINIANGVEGKLTIGSANKKDQKQLDGEKGIIQLGYNKNNAEDGWRPNNYNGQETTVKVNYTTDEAKRWQGWNTALKPSFEPIIVARKPFDGTLIDNVLKYGVGGINIDECRIELENGYEFKETNRQTRQSNVFTGENCGFKSETNNTASASPLGRYPANTILTYDETDEKEVCGGSIARYFYCAKASKRDRDEGLDEFEEKRKAGYGYDKGYMNAGEGMFKERQTLKRNTHPTVKPTALMQYLVRLVTPKGGTVLDPFNGSGSTGKAVMYENKDRSANYKYIGIELTEEYLPIARARIEYADKSEEAQVSLLDFIADLRKEQRAE